MVSPAIYEYLLEFIPKENILLKEAMDKHTTFRVGGEAEAFVKIDNREQLSKIVSYLNKTEKEYFILGNGSNLLVGDKGYKGIVIQISPAMGNIVVEGNLVTVEAGALLTRVSKAMTEHGLTGLEFAAGIPGTVGGAIVMNAGAYDGEVCQVVKTVTIMDKDGNLMELDGNSMEFGYRTSIIKKKPFVVVEVTMELEKGDPKAIQDKMDDLNSRRREKQPLEYASAGSTFKRPEGTFAGKLIMDAGLRGYRIGGAQVSEKHCGFVVNLGTATAADVSEVIEVVKEKVKLQTGIDLETEVVYLGDF